MKMVDGVVLSLMPMKNHASDAFCIEKVGTRSCSDRSQQIDKPSVRPEEVVDESS